MSPLIGSPLLLLTRDILPLQIALAVLIGKYKTGGQNLTALLIFSILSNSK